jgi:hypothetical protein
MSDQMKALQALIAVLAAGIKDTEAALQPGESLMQKLMAYGNLAPQVMALIPQIGNISVAGLQPSDYVTLAESLVTDLAVSNAHAKAILDAAFQLVNDGVKYMLPDVEALIAAIKAPAAPVATA